jgi:hypothetical protein
MAYFVATIARFIALTPSDFVSRQERPTTSLLTGITTPDSLTLAYGYVSFSSTGNQLHRADRVQVQAPAGCRPVAAAYARGRLPVHREQASL